MRRRNLQLRLTEDARRGWDRFATSERVTVTALIEAIGLELRDGRKLFSARTVNRAAAIDRARSSRR